MGRLRIGRARVPHFPGGWGGTAGPGYENQEAFMAVLGFVPRIVLASLSGYLVGQLLNAYVVVKIKERTKERHLWARLIGSTVVGEFADTCCSASSPSSGCSRRGAH